MFIQNQIENLANHENIITNEIEKSNEMLLIVAYVRENGVDIILDKIKNKPVKLLCSFDMGITQLSGIRKLLQNGNVEVKVYKSNKGTFHPKIWLFSKNKNDWKMLIGSANLTRAAFIENVEASVLVEDKSITSNALMFFQYLWYSENSNTIDVNEIETLERKVKDRKKIEYKNKANKNDIEKNQTLLKYVKNWIDIPKCESKGISSLWRGWYIIPDQGYIKDARINDLKSYLPFIKKGILIGEKSDDKNYLELLEKFKTNSNFKRTVLKMRIHALFVRQAKNYLLKLGWCSHPIKENGKLDKKRLLLTDLGIQINQTNDLEGVKILYSDYFNNYLFNGLGIVRFTKQLLRELKSLTLDEFNYFVIHAYSDEDFDLIVNLIKIYRSLSNKDQFKKQFTDYFEKIKGGTGENVYGNYFKSIKYNISIIGWCNGFSLDYNNFELKLNDE